MMICVYLFSIDDIVANFKDFIYSKTTQNILGTDMGVWAKNEGWYKIKLGKL